MRLAIHQFRRADEASFSYTGLNPALRDARATWSSRCAKPIDEILVPKPEGAPSYLRLDTG